MHFLQYITWWSLKRPTLTETMMSHCGGPQCSVGSLFLLTPTPPPTPFRPGSHQAVPTSPVSKNDVTHLELGGNRPFALTGILVVWVHSGTDDVTLSPIKGLVHSRGLHHLTEVSKHDVTNLELAGNWPFALMENFVVWIYGGTDDVILSSIRDGSIHLLRMWWKASLWCHVWRLASWWQPGVNWASCHLCH